MRQGRPLVPQQAHDVGIMMLASCKMRVTQGGLVRKSCLLIGAPGAIVPRVDVQPYALEAQLAEAEVADGAQRIGPEALVPFLLFADCDPKLGGAVVEVDRVQARRPDRSGVGQQADDEVVVGAALHREHAIEPCGLARGAHRGAHGKVAQNVRIIEPAHEEGKIATLGWTQEDLVAPDDRRAVEYAAHLRPSLASQGEPIAMAATRTATVTWNGNLASGSGTVTAGSSELFTDLPVSWASRTESPAGQTSPEELLAAAHASCFSMQLSGGLDRAGTPPDHLHVSATVTFDKVGDAWSVTTSQIDVIGVVPGLDDAAFDAAAQAAKEDCPISRALAGNVELSVSAALEDEHE